MNQELLLWIFNVVGISAWAMILKHLISCGKIQRERSLAEARIEGQLLSMMRVFDFLEAFMRSQQQHVSEIATLREKVGEIQGELGDRETGIRGSLHQIPNDFGKIMERIVKLETRNELKR